MEDQMLFKIPYKVRTDFNNLLNHREISFSVNITKVKEWLRTKRKEKRQGRKEKKKMGTVWIYDGCDCIPDSGAGSVPYCPEHYNPLIRIEEEII